MDQRAFVEEVMALLHKEYPSPVTELNFENEMQLAIAVVLSAQTTDKKVNQVTEGLFKKYGSWEEFASAELTELQKDIYGVNFHMGKAERLIKMARKIVSDHNGALPRTMEELTQLPGVARKSANVIMQELWGIAEGVVVDTHISRVSQRLGFTDKIDPAKIEQDLMKVLPKEEWRHYSGAVVLHGRYICIARKPRCAECVLNKLCPSAFTFE